MTIRRILTVPTLPNLQNPQKEKKDAIAEPARGSNAAVAEPPAEAAVAEPPDDTAVAKPTEGNDAAVAGPAVMEIESTDAEPTAKSPRRRIANSRDLRLRMLPPMALSPVKLQAHGPGHTRERCRRRSYYRARLREPQGRTRSRSRRRNSERLRLRSRERTHSRSRGVVNREEGRCRMHAGLQRDLVPRPAINSAPASSAELPAAPPAGPPAGPLPASVGKGNLMIATWIIGQECRMMDLGPKLRDAPFDCIVVIMSTAVKKRRCDLGGLLGLDTRWAKRRQPRSRGSEEGEVSGPPG